MGQAIARDLGLQQNEKEIEKLQKLERVVSEMVKKRINGNQSMSLQRSRFMSGDEDEDEDFEEDEVEDDEEDEFSIDESSHNGKKGIISSESSHIDSHQDSNFFTTEPIKTTQTNPNLPYKRHFQSIKIDKFFLNHDYDDEEDEHDSNMLNGMSDEDENESPIQNQQLNMKDSSHQHQKKIHNINHQDDVKMNGSAQNLHHANDSDPPQIKFQQQIVNKEFDFNIQSESEQSQFGDVFSSGGSDAEKGSHSDYIRSGTLSGKGEVNKSKAIDDENEENKYKINVKSSQKTNSSFGKNSKKSTNRKQQAQTPSKSQTQTPSKNPSSNQISPNIKPPSSQKQNDKPFFFPQTILQKQDSDNTQKYKKYLSQYFPDRKEN